MSPQEIVEAFVAAFNRMEIDAACDMLSEDVDYHNIPMEPIHGREAARAFLTGMEGVTAIQWDMVNIAANGEMVLTERVDRFEFGNGGTLAIPLMGVFRVANGEITEWRDYFDLADFQRQSAALGG